MKMNKSEKVALVKSLAKEMGNYKTIAIMPTSGVPDRLFQKARNKVNKVGKVVVARHTLVNRVLQQQKLEVLAPYITGNVALIMTNKEPGELYELVSENKLKLAAKPRQVAPADISIVAGETSVAPGQAVTDLKNAGVDVKIDRGKVVISKGKVLVAKGQKVTAAAANALKMLDIMPFSVSTVLSAAYSEKLLYKKEALEMTPEFIKEEIAKTFNGANNLALEIGYVTKYNVPIMLARAYAAAEALEKQTAPKEAAKEEKKEESKEANDANKPEEKQA